MDEPVPWPHSFRQSRVYDIEQTFLFIRVIRSIAVKVSLRATHVRIHAGGVFVEMQKRG